MTKVAVVAPVDMGRGIKKDDTKKKYEVDLTDYVDGTTVQYTNGKLSATGGGGSADGNTKNSNMAVTAAGVLQLTDTDGNMVQVTLPSLCDGLKKLTKSTQAQGDYVLALSSSGECKLIPAPTANQAEDERNSPFYCWVPYAVVPTTNAATQNQEASVSYKFRNNYENQIRFTFEFTNANTLPYDVVAVTKSSGQGSVTQLPNNGKGASVTIPAGGEIQFLVRYIPRNGGNYTFLMTGQSAQEYGKDLSGGNSFSACGRAWDDLSTGSGGQARVAVVPA